MVWLTYAKPSSNFKILVLESSSTFLFNFLHIIIIDGINRRVIKIKLFCISRTPIFSYSKCNATQCPSQVQKYLLVHFWISIDWRSNIHTQGFLVHGIFISIYIGSLSIPMWFLKFTAISKISPSLIDVAGYITNFKRKNHVGVFVHRTIYAFLVYAWPRLYNLHN